MTKLDEIMGVIRKYAPNFRAKVGLILGSGLGTIADQITNPITIPFQAMGLSAGTISGHASMLVLGMLDDVPVACLKGRLHLYEGTPYESICALVRVLRHLGARTVIVTGAAGSLRQDTGPGELMMLTDHINFLPGNPLVGINDESIGPRFVSMEHAYDPDLSETMEKVAARLNIRLAKGVYLATIGPSFETPAEIRAFRTLGADAVGMSVVPEVIVARHSGMHVVGLIAVTNFAVGMNDAKVTHEGTLEFGAIAARNLVKLIITFIKEAGLSLPPEYQNSPEFISDTRLAAQILALIDLTSLNEGDTPASIMALCDKAITALGHVAAICVYPQFIALAAKMLAGTPVKIAAVANFPHGNDALPNVLASIEDAIQNGANEIDVVFPYQAYLAGEEEAATDFIAKCKTYCGNTVLLKVILETGALPTPQIITNLSRAAITAGADFIKTSTGKIPIGATLAAAQTMLEVIQQMSPGLSRSIGFKASGGVRTIPAAAEYMQLAQNIMGKSWVSPKTFRLGASQLFDVVMASF